MTKAQRKIISNEERKLYQTHKILKTLGHEPKDNKVFGNKIRELDEKELFVHWREAWAHHCNRELEQTGLDLRITVKSLSARGITDQIPINEPLKIAEMRKNHEQNPDKNPLPEICKLNNEFKKLNLLVKYRKSEIAKEQAKLEHERDGDYLTWLQAKLEQELALVKAVKEFRKQEKDEWKKERGFDEQPKERKKRQRKDQDIQKQQQKIAIAIAELQKIEPTLTQAEIDTQWENQKKQERIAEIQEIRVQQSWRKQERNRYLQEQQEKESTFDPLLTKKDHKPQAQEKSFGQPTPEQPKEKGKEPRDPTYQIVKRHLNLMGGEEFEIGIYDRAEDKMRNRSWSKDEILNYDPHTQKAKIINWLKLQNQQGKDIYIRLAEKDGKQQGLILLDDINGVTVEEMKDAGFAPAVVVETSFKNLQAWVRVSHDLLDRDEASTVSKLLARQWGGDKGSAGFQHYGRLAGFSNRKEEHRDIYSGKYPFARLFYKDSSGAIAPKAENLLAEARAILEQEKIARANLPQPIISQRPASDREKHKALEVFTKLYEEQTKKGGKLDYSSVDYAICCRMAKRNWNSDALAHALEHGSPDLESRKNDVPYYVGITLKKVFENKDVLQSIAEHQSKRQKRENKTTSAIQKIQKQKGEQHQAQEFTEDQRQLIEMQKWMQDGKERGKQGWEQAQYTVLATPPANQNFVPGSDADNEAKLKEWLQFLAQQRCDLTKPRTSKPPAPPAKPKEPVPVSVNENKIEAQRTKAGEKIAALKDFRRLYRMEFENYPVELLDDLDNLVCRRLVQQNYSFNAIKHALRYGSYDLQNRKQAALSAYVHQMAMTAYKEGQEIKVREQRNQAIEQKRQQIRTTPQRVAANENKQNQKYQPSAVGKLTSADAALLQQMALQSKLSQQQLDRAVKALHYHHNSPQDYSTWKRLQLCRLEYLRELGRKYFKFGKEAVFHPGSDAKIAMKLKAAGFTNYEVRIVIARNSPITASMKNHAEQGEYINAAIRPHLHSQKMIELEKNVRAWRQEQEKTHPHIRTETRLDKLGLATKWEPQKQQSKQQTRDARSHAPSPEKGDREPEM